MNKPVCGRGFHFLSHLWMKWLGHVMGIPVALHAWHAWRAEGLLHPMVASVFTCPGVNTVAWLLSLFSSGNLLWWSGSLCILYVFSWIYSFFPTNSLHVMGISSILHESLSIPAYTVWLPIYSPHLFFLFFFFLRITKFLNFLWG